MPPLTHCADLQALGDRERPPAEVAAEVQGIEAEVADYWTQWRAGHREGLLEQARALMQRAEASGWLPVIASARHCLGTAIEDSHGQPEAIEVLMKALEESLRAEDRGAAARIAYALSSLLADQGSDDDEALLMARFALALARGLPQDTTVEADALVTVGQYLDDIADAEPLMREGVELMRQRVGPDDPRLAAPLHTLAARLAFERRYDEALELYDEAMRNTEAAYGAEHPRMVAMHNALGMTIADARGPADGIPHLRRAVELSERINGDSHRDTLAVMGNLAAKLSGTGDHGAALELTREAAARYAKEHDTTTRDYFSFRQNIANYLMLAGRLQEAEAEVRATIELRQAAGNDPNLGSTIFGLAEILRKQGRAGEAVVQFRRAAAFPSARPEGKALTELHLGKRCSRMVTSMQRSRRSRRRGR